MNAPDPAFFSALERELAQGAARGADKLAPHAAGGLEHAATRLARPGGTVALITGFYIARAAAPAAETDGPLAAAAIAEALIASGRDAVLVTDPLCAPVLRALCAEAGWASDRLWITEDAAALEARLARHDVDTLFAIERPGRAADGHCYSMRGDPLSAHTPAFDAVFHAGRHHTLAAGDGGNEIGMGGLPPAVIAEHVPRGAAIASTTPADALIIGGVSHWSAYALASAMTRLAPEHADAWRAAVSDERETRRMRAALRAGAVDGVTLQSAATIDGLAMETHRAKREALLALARHR